ncbi:MAG TPA: hypothetical protein VE244_02705, partial [Nitrososphaeraceae archaeon]|nr:hypothetical protein [Nitrososphaeraceae archaeon]
MYLFFYFEVSKGCCIGFSFFYLLLLLLLFRSKFNSTPDAIKNNRTFYNEAISTVNAPSMIWFSKDGRLAFVGSQKESVMDVIDTISKKSIAVVNLTKADPIGFTP